MDRTLESQNSPEKIHIYTDGGCWPNPGGNGGAAAIVLMGGQKILRSQGYRNTTNNRMELRAALIGLWQIPASERVTLFSDSKYVVNGLNFWRHSWRKRNWKRKDGKRLIPVSNSDLWVELDRLADRLKLTCKWVRGHNGDALNEQCDAMAYLAARGILREDRRDGFGVAKAPSVHPEEPCLALFRGHEGSPDAQ